MEFKVFKGNSQRFSVLWTNKFLTQQLFLQDLLLRVLHLRWRQRGANCTMVGPSGTAVATASGVGTTVTAKSVRTRNRM